MATTDAQARRHQLLAGAAIGALSWLVLGVLYLLGVFEPFDLRLLDLKFQLRGERQGASGIALVGVDDETIRGYGGWPLPRDSYALLLTALEDAGARAIGVDLQFPNDRNQQPEWNQLLAHVSGAHENIVHAMSFYAQGSPGAVPAPQLEAMSRHGTVSREPRIAAAGSAAVPFDALLESTPLLGHVSVAVDPDGGIRRLPLFVRHGDRAYPALAVVLHGVSNDLRSAPTLHAPRGGTRIRWSDAGEIPIQVDRQGSTSIDYAGDREAFPDTYSMLDVLQWYQGGEKERLRATFEGKTVLLGLTSQEEASEDVGATPFSVATPLLYVHANVLDNLVRGKFLSRPAAPLYLGALAGVGVVAGVIFSTVSIPLGAAVTGAALVGIAGSIQGALSWSGIEIPTILCLLLPPIVYAGAGGYRHLFLERRTRAREAEIREGLTIQQQFLPEAFIGKQISRYRIEARLGAGGMGVVYRGVDVETSQPVAIKVLPGAELADEKMRRRFRHEAVALSRVTHPHIARLIEFDSQDGIDFIAMEFVVGESLHETLTRGPLPEPRAIAIADQVCDALAAAHARGILHRDLKPANVMLTESGEVKLLDFGIARLGNVGTTMATVTGGMTESGQMMGTLPYMAPEVLRGEPADERTDVYGVGVLLFEMLTGQRPFRDDAPHELMYVILNQPPPRLSVLNGRIGVEVEDLVLRMLAKDPGERPNDAAEVRRLLREGQLFPLPGTLS